MKTLYYATPSAAIAVNFKAGSATLARAVIAAHYPDIEARITAAPGDGNGTAYPDGMGADDVRWHAQCPKVDPAERPLVLVALRDPVEKFRSACAESGVSDVNGKLDELESAGFGRNAHFWPQERLLVKGCRLYRFPEDLEALARDAGLILPLPNIPTRGIEKPALTAAQARRVRTLYANDQTVFDSIKAAGKPYRKPVDPATFARLQAARIEEARFRRQQLEQGGFTFMGMQIPSDRESQAMINGAVVAAQIDPTFTTVWQVSPDHFVTLDAATILAMGKALRDHVAGAFATQAATVAQLLNAQSPADLEAASV